MVVTPTCCTAKESKICINEFEQWGLERLHIVHLEMTKVKKRIAKKILTMVLYSGEMLSTLASMNTGTRFSPTIR